jgi:GTP-binding protein EngB required for normal cell division/F0F1-type ATP synthase membrane subunit b/b'
MINSYKQELKIYLENIMIILEEMKNLLPTIRENKKLRSSVQSINRIIYNGISHTNKEINSLENNVEWDSFNISFFGETNAGKSTLIEALTRGDGSSIGEGYKDYTKCLRKIKYGNINFLDMPGIEGKEKGLEKEIKCAVEKSHVIFYIIGTNKEPEEPTLVKIKNYLNDQAKIYTILNVRGKPTMYRDKKILVNEKTQKIEERIKLKFKKLLNGYYEFNITTNAYLGFLSVNKNSRIYSLLAFLASLFCGRRKMVEIAKDKKKTLQVFDSLESAYDLSNLNTIEELVSSLSESSINEIIISNTYKFLKTIESTISNIKKGKNDFDLCVKETKKQIKNVLDETQNIMNKYQDEIRRLINIQINQMKTELINIIYTGIDNKWTEKQLKIDIKRINNIYSKKIENKIKKLLDGMKSEIENSLNEFKKRIQINLKFLDLNSDIKIEKIIKELDISIKYVFNQIIDTALSIGGIIMSFLSNPILGIITAIFAIIGKIWDWLFGDPEKRKRNAKNKAYNEINTKFGELKKKCFKDIDSKTAKLQNDIKRQMDEIFLYIKDVEKFSPSLNDKIGELNKIKAQISTSLSKNILGNDVELSYIDLKLNKMLIIGSEFRKDDLKIFRMKRIYSYKSKETCLNNLKYTINKEVLYLRENNELMYKFLSAFCDNFKIKRVRRLL